MADISQVILLDNNLYDLKDRIAREDLSTENQTVSGSIVSFNSKVEYPV